MRDLPNCITIVVSIYCVDDDDCDFTNYDITVGKWVIANDARYTIRYDTAAPAGDLLPHQVMSWEYWESWRGGGGDSQLTLTGNININILCLYIDISTVEGAPEYPENLIVKDKTGDRANLVGVYRKQGDSRVWKYGDYEVSFNGEY